MKKILFILLLLATVAGTARGSLSKENLLLLDSLVQAEERLTDLVEKQKSQIDSIKQLRMSMEPSPERVLAGMHIGDSFLNQDIDSSLTYWHLAIGEADALGFAHEKLLLRLRILSSLPRNGIAIEALESFKKIDPRGMTADERKEYWRRSADLYYYIQMNYPAGVFKENYRRRVQEALDSLSSFYPRENPMRRYIKAQNNMLRGEENLAAADFMELMPELEHKSEHINTALWCVAKYYKDRPDYRQLYINYMLRLCLNTMREGRPQPYIMAETGLLLATEGKEQIGRELMATALSIKETGAQSYPSFDRSKYAAHLNKSTKRASIILISIICCLCALCIVLFFVVRRKSEIIHSKESQLAIVESDKLKIQEEMSSINANIILLALLSTDLLQEYNLFVIRKIKAHQIADLTNEIESGKYMQGLNAKFFETFDEYLLNAHPDFIDRLNTLLEPDKQLTLLPNGSLSPELRIAILVRLGIHESSKISKLLGLSLNTIYTYRNRLKGRARDRDSFEKNLQNIPLKC